MRLCVLKQQPKKKKKNLAETNLMSVQSRGKNVLFMPGVNRTSARRSRIEILFPVGDCSMRGSNPSSGVNGT